MYIYLLAFDGADADEDISGMEFQAYATPEAATAAMIARVEALLASEGDDGLDEEDLTFFRDPSPLNADVRYLAAQHIYTDLNEGQSFIGVFHLPVAE